MTVTQARPLGMARSYLLFLSALLLFDDDLLIGGWDLFSDEHLLVLPSMLQSQLPQLVVVGEDALPEVVSNEDHAGHEEERDGTATEAASSFNSVQMCSMQKAGGGSMSPENDLHLCACTVSYFSKIVRNAYQ